LHEPQKRERQSCQTPEPVPVEGPAAPSWFQHPQALVESGQIGAGTRIWAFAHVLPGARIGQDCNICDHVFVENEVTVGDRVTVKCGVQLWDGITLEDGVFVGPNATFTNDPFPRSKVYPERFSPTLVRQGASIGANATILPGLEIGRNALVAAGAVVTREVPAHAVVAGNPAQVIGFVGQEHRRLEPRTFAPGFTGESGVGGTRFIPLPLVQESRGSLCFGQFDQHLPFQPKRYFLIRQVPGDACRGGHAHLVCEQFLVCAAGSCRLVLDDGRDREEVLLDGPTIGVHIPPRVWAWQYRYSPDAVLLVLASEPYDPQDYVREYEEFIKIQDRCPGEAG